MVGGLALSTVFTLILVPVLLEIVLKCTRRPNGDSTGPDEDDDVSGTVPIGTACRDPLVTRPHGRWCVLLLAARSARTIAVHPSQYRAERGRSVDSNRRSFRHRCDRRASKVDLR